MSFVAPLRSTVALLVVTALAMIILAATAVSAQTDHYLRPPTVPGPSGEPTGQPSEDPTALPTDEPTDEATQADGDTTDANATVRTLPVQPYTFSGGEVLVSVGASIQEAVDAHPAGTHFRIAAGVHRSQSVQPKDGNTFTGEPGAVLNGAVVLDPTDFRRDGNVWVIGGQTARGFVHGQTEPGAERHANPNDLFLGGTRAGHVNVRAAVTAPGTWFFDYDRQEIVVFDDPTRVGGVELSVAESAFRSAAQDVTIQHLTITRYASPAQHGAIHAAEGYGWEVGYTTVTSAHGSGIRIGAGMYLHHSRISDSGQIGVGGTDEHNGRQAPVLIEFNEISNNRTLRYDWGWEGGATKFALTRGLVFQNNWVHDNRGPGVWFDVDNADATIRANVVEDNDQAGVFYEISFGATIHDNVIRNNGRTAYGDLGAGVHVATSTNVEVHHNAIYGNRSAVMATQDDRGSGHLGLRETIGLNVHHNDIVSGPIPMGLRVYYGDDAHYTQRAGNRFEDNTYRISPTDTVFWAGGDLDLIGWQLRGHDLGAVLAPSGSTPQLRAPSAAFESAPVGAIVTP